MKKPKKYEFVNEDEFPVIEDDRHEKWWDDGNNINSGNNNSGPMTPYYPLNPGENSWFQNIWRPAMAWQYIAVCLFDFMIAPILTMVFFKLTGGDYIPWEPLTLASGGFYHIAMGAVCGITAYGRTSEKIKEIEIT